MLLVFYVVVQCLIYCYLVCNGFFRFQTRIDVGPPFVFELLRRHGTPRQVYSRAETLGTLLRRAGRGAHHFYDRSYCATCSSTTCRGDESACEHYSTTTYLLAFLSHLDMTERSDTDTIHVSKMISASFQIPSGYTQRTYVNKCTARSPISTD